MGRVIFDFLTKKPEQQTGSATVMTLNLNKIHEPQPTDKMLHVLFNLRKYGYINQRQYESACNSFLDASALIEAHQDDMHEHVGEMVSNYRSYSRSGGGGYSHEWTELDSIGCECGLFW